MAKNRIHKLKILARATHKNNTIYIGMARYLRDMIDDRYKYSINIEKHDMTSNNMDHWCWNNFTEDYVLYRRVIYTNSKIDLMAYRLKWT